MSTIAMNNLASRSLIAVFWGAGGAVLRLALQFGAQVVLARILGPEQYGIFAVGAIVISFSNFFSDVGLAYGLIQKKNVSANDIRFVFTWQIILGLAVTVAIYFAAETIATFFGDQRAAGVIQALSAICLLNALAAPSLNLLKRDLDFRRIQIAQISGFCLGYIMVGIPLALFGSQVWALVLAWMVQAFSIFIIAYLATRHPLRPLVNHDEAAALGAYGGTVLITNLINWVISNIDRVIVGRMFTSREIGLYATSYNMLQTPTTSILGIIQPVFFSASARLADSQEKIAAGYRTLLAAISTYLMPAFFSLAVVSKTFIVGLYGQKWFEAASILPPIAIAMPLYLIWGMTTPLLWTGGHASKEYKIQLPLAILWVVACWGAAQHSFVAVAWTVLVLYLVRSLLLVFVTARYLSIDISSIWKAIRGGLALSIAVATGLGVADATLLVAFPPSLRLVVDIGIGASLLLLGLRLFPVLISRDLSDLNSRLLLRLPRRLASVGTFLAKK